MRHFKIITLTFLILCMNIIYCNTSLASNSAVSIHAEDTHLPTILAMLAKQSGYNIVTGPNVKSQETLSIHLDDVPVNEAIKSLKLVHSFYSSIENKKWINYSSKLANSRKLGV